MANNATKGDRMTPSWEQTSHQQGLDPVTIGQRIRTLRKQKGLSQAELGELIGSDAGRVSRYEAGRITPSADALIRIAETFDTSLDHLLIDNIPPRPLHSIENILGNRLHQLTELDTTDINTITNIIDGLLAKHRLKTITNAS